MRTRSQSGQDRPRKRIVAHSLPRTAPAAPRLVLTHWVDADDRCLRMCDKAAVQALGRIRSVKIAKHHDRRAVRIEDIEAHV